jgi:hypothetical protein
VEQIFHAESSGHPLEFVRCDGTAGDRLLHHLTETFQEAANRISPSIISVPQTPTAMVSTSIEPWRTLRCISTQRAWLLRLGFALLEVRYEYESPMTIATNVYSRIDPATGILLAAGLNGVSRSLNINTPKGNVSPRLGLAYSVDNKTVVRAAFGTFYGTIFQNLGGQLAYPGI